jgi:hypothetical protein
LKAPAACAIVAAYRASGLPVTVALVEANHAAAILGFFPVRASAR